MKNETSFPRTATRPARVCSGACPYFQAVYEAGRKVAGAGACSRHASGATVKVGICCLWTADGSLRSPNVIPLQMVHRKHALV
jgi:hypothetical protein